MTIAFSTALRQLHAASLVSEAGSGALLKIYTTPKPANVAATATGTLLGTLTCSSTLGSSSSGVVTLNAVTSDTNADATGTAAWFRLTKSDGTTGVMDGTVTGTGGGGDLTLDSTSITSGGTIALTASGTITMGGAT